jgi:hypothetical protein
MVDVGQNQMREEALPQQPEQDVCQGDAIGAARQRHHAARSGQARLFEETSHNIVEHW